MNVITHQLLQQVKNALILSVFITCIVLLTVGWKNMDQTGLDGALVRPRTYVYTSLEPSPRGWERDYIYTKDSQSFSLASSPEPTCTRKSTSTAVQPQQTPTASKSQDLLVSNQGTPSCNNPNATVLGRPLDRCAASEAVKLAEEEDIYVSVKTTARNHKGRILPDLLTWFQTLNPQRVHIVTDTALKNETFYQVANKIGIDVVTTDCESVHSHKALCCKSRNEYFRYFNSTTASGDLHRWYCHFDDDHYVNIPALVPALREAMNKSSDGGVYFGRWPEEKTKKTPKGFRTSAGSLRKLGFDFKKDLYARWATGAAYCLSSVVMEKLKVILTERTFEQYCAHFGVSDDVTAAILIGIAGYAVSDNKNIITQYDKLAEIPVERLKTLITSSKGYKDNAIKIPCSIFTSEEDETSFLSYHCLLYPSTSWCKKSN